MQSGNKRDIYLVLRNKLLTLYKQLNYEENEIYGSVSKSCHRIGRL